MNREMIPAVPAPADGTPTRRSRMNLFPEDFEPGIFDVICGRGKKCYSHIGNDKFRQLVMGRLDEYSKARSKLDKSAVLNDVVEQVRLASPQGGFVKQEESGRWYEVGDFLAREKTSQAFRDCLHESYKSSNVAKKKRRQEEQAKQSDKLQKFSNPDFSRGMKRFPPDRAFGASDIRSQTSLDIFNQMNRLAEIREDETAFAAGPTPHFRLTNQNTSGSFNFSDANPNPFDQFGRDSVARHPMRSSSEMSARSRNHAESVFADVDGRRGVQRSFSLPVQSDGSTPSAHMPAFGLGGSLNLDTGGGAGYPNDGPGDMHSSLPNMNFMSQMYATRNNRELSEGLHHSMPQIQFSEAQMQNSWPAQSRPQDDLAVHRLRAESRERNAHLKPMSRGDGVSKDMMACLEKLNESTLGGGAEAASPFDPIPLTPLQEQRCKQVSADHRAGLVQRIQDSGLMDEPIYTPSLQAPQSISEQIDRVAFGEGGPPFGDEEVDEEMI